MSTYVQLKGINEEIKDNISKYSYNSNYGRKRHALQCKENISKIKYNKSLKQKLKKYKLRKDGKDDEDILDVSRTLFLSLQIKSPNKQVNNIFQQVAGERELLKPKNYLSTMIRNKQNIKVSAITCPLQNKNIEKISDTSLYEVAVNVNNSKNEEKQHTNAFKLLMDSRHNSIGTNSSGKVKSSPEDCALEEVLEKKNTKAKRNMLLQKMAEAKGSITNIKIEQQKEDCINRKMKKRAQRLKEMITTNNLKSPKGSKNINITIESPIKLNNKIPSEKSLTLINLFEDSSNDTSDITHHDRISREDQEFLNKLSPSMKKKENMLCYFTKIEKEPDIIEDDDSNNIIKVKLTTRHKNKGKKKKKNLNTNEDKSLSNITSEVQTTNIKNNLSDPKEKDITIICEDIKNNINTNETKELRSRRNIKRPIKYTDDAELSSEDEVLTPKRKRHRENKSETQINRKTKVDKASNDIDTIKTSSTKLAPIFKKQQVDPAVLEAKQKFLQSGIPDKLKKPKAQEDKCVVVSQFPVVVHIQQYPTKYTNDNVEMFNISKNMT